MSFMGKLLNTAYSIGAVVGLTSAIGWGIAAYRGPSHAEYHFNGQLGSQTVSYKEENKFNLFFPGYDGWLEVRDGNGIGYRWIDWNNNLKIDKGDRVTLINGEAKTSVKVDLANPNIENIVSQLQPKIGSVLEQVLEHNTALLRGNDRGVGLK